MEEIKLKICIDCKEYKEVKYFYKYKRSKSGYKPRCKNCTSLKYYGKPYINLRGKASIKSIEYSDGTKLCTTCNEIKNKFYFTKDKSVESGLSSSCKDCKRFSKIKNNYGIDKKDYLNLLKIQNNKCKICKEKLLNNKDIHLDHCHNSNIIRGILCNYCNVGLGMFKDNINLLLNAAEYLQNFKSIIPLEEQRN